MDRDERQAPVEEEYLDQGRVPAASPALRRARAQKRSWAAVNEPDARAWASVSEDGIAPGLRASTSR